jgi:hypothetical protein
VDHPLQFDGTLPGTLLEADVSFGQFGQLKVVVLVDEMVRFGEILG